MFSQNRLQERLNSIAQCGAVLGGLLRAEGCAGCIRLCSSSFDTWQWAVQSTGQGCVQPFPVHPQPVASELCCAHCWKQRESSAGLCCCSPAGLRALPIAQSGSISPAASQHLLKPEGASSLLPFRCQRPAALFSSHNHTPAWPCDCGLGYRM